MKDYLEKILSLNPPSLGINSSTLESMKALGLNNSALESARASVAALGVNNSALESMKALGLNNSALESARASVAAFGVSNSALESMKALGLNNSALESARASVVALGVNNSALESMKALGLNNSALESARASVAALGISNSALESMKALGLNNSALESARASVAALGVNNSALESMKALGLNNSTLELARTLQTSNPLIDSLRELEFNNPLLHSIKVLQVSDPLKIFRSSVKELQPHSSFDSILDTISEEKYLETDGINLHVTEEGAISIGSNSISQQQLQELAITVLETSFEEVGSCIDLQLENIAKEINSLKDPFLQKIMGWLIYPIIVGLVLAVVAPISDYYIKKELSSEEKRVVVKEVKKSIANKIDNKSILSSFRIVTTSTLNVRESNSNKSAILGQLHLGYVVEVIKKERKWSLVSWHDSNANISLQGWVFSRYIKPIK